MCVRPFMNVDGRSESATHKRMCFTSLRNPLYMTNSLTQTVLLFLSLGSGENITLSEMFILLMGHEHSHTEVYVIPITLMGSSKGCFQIISSKLWPVSVTRALVSWGSSQITCLRFLWLRGTDLHYLLVQHHSSHPRNLMEHSKFRLLWRILRLHLSIHSSLLNVTCEKGKCAFITIIQLLKNGIGVT